MKTGTRLGVALIAGCLIAKRNASAIFDCFNSRTFIYSGIVSPDRIYIFDQERKCHMISGDAVSSTYTIHDGCNGQHISLLVNENQFSGYDYNSCSNFKGDVNGNFISLHDFEDMRYHHYSF